LALVKIAAERKDKMKYVGPTKRFVAAAFAALASCVVLAADSPNFGKTLVGEHKVPADIVIKYDNLKIERVGKEPAQKGPSEITWVGPQFAAEPKNNPYKLSVKMLGVARADGDAALVWQAGFRREDDSTNANTLLMAYSKVKAGETLLLEAAAPPLSFKEPQKLAPALALVARRNIDIQSVEVKVWSGIGSSSWLEVLLSFWYLWVGIVVLFLWFRWKRA
jgi:hypothetical protein